MTPSQVEQWALRVLTHIHAGSRVEDARVEVKSQWPPAERAARSVAGLCNSVRSEHVLWIVGIDEQTGVVSANAVEPADWFAQFKACFDGIYPPFLSIHVPFNTSSVTAICFESSRAPFVVKNPDYGNARGVNIAFEVPWREGTAVRTARRHELLLLLAAGAANPTAEVVGGQLLVQWVEREKDAYNPSWSLGLDLYLTPGTDTPAVIPFHKCRADLMLDWPAKQELASNVSGWGQMRMSGSKDGPMKLEQLSKTIHVSPSEIVVAGPGKVHLSAGWTTNIRPVPSDVRPKVHLRLGVVDAPRPITIDLSFDQPPEVDSLTGHVGMTWPIVPRL